MKLELGEGPFCKYNKNSVEEPREGHMEISLRDSFPNEGSYHVGRSKCSASPILIPGLEFEKYKWRELMIGRVLFMSKIDWSKLD